MITRMPMARRPGLTLTEALVAMFVAALGMISLLTLFPLGALQMGQALKDSRTAETARQADSLMGGFGGATVLQRLAHLQGTEREQRQQRDHAEIGRAHV